MIKRMITLVLTVMLLAVPFTSYAAESTISDSCSNNSAYDSNDKSAILLDVNEDVLDPNDYGTSYEIEKGIETGSVGTGLIKKAIKIVLKDYKKAVPIIEKLGGKRAATAFSKHFNKVSPQLKALLKWSDIPYQAVHDAVYRGLINAGVSRSTATKAALALKEGLSWLL